MAKKKTPNLPLTTSNSNAIEPETPLPPVPPTSFLIEKHRYTKGRLNSKVETVDGSDPPLCLRFGSHFIKTTFLINGCCARSHPSHEEVILLNEYNRICEIYVNLDWQVNRAALEACTMTSADLNRASRPLQRREIFTVSEKAENQTSLQTATAESESLKAIFDARVAQRKRKRVLVPFSGGLSSMAILWWCLLNDYDIFLCYAFGALDSTAKITEKPAEIECLLRLLQYARKTDGKLLFDRHDEPESGVHQLTRAEIAQRIRVVQVPQSAYYLADSNALQQQREPFCSDMCGARLKAHPQAYLLFYRQMVTVAQSLDCSGIAIGMHGDARQLFKGAQPFFSKVHTHDLLLPFETRTEALIAFQEASEQSWLVWKSYFEQQQQEEGGGVWQTAGPALMPNASHYVATCSTTTRLAREQILLQAQTAALERVQCLLDDDAEKEQAKIDAALARGEKLRKKRAPDPFQHSQYLAYFIEEMARQQCADGGEASKNTLFHFCDNCLDCWQWREITSEWNRGDHGVAPQWQNLATEYLARIRGTVRKQRPVEETFVVSEIKKEKGLPPTKEISLAELQTLHRKRHRNDGNNDEKSEEEEEEDEAAFEDEMLVDDEEEQDERQSKPEDEEDAIGTTAEEGDVVEEEEDGGQDREDGENGEDGEEEEKEDEDDDEEDDEDDEDLLDDDLDDDNDGDDGSDY